MKRSLSVNDMGLICEDYPEINWVQISINRLYQSHYQEMFPNRPITNAEQDEIIEKHNKVKVKLFEKLFDNVARIKLHDLRKKTFEKIDNLLWINYR